MDALEFALRRYKQIVPEPIIDYLELPLENLRVWLATEVQAALEEYVCRPDFREASAWPITALSPGASTPERTLIDLAAANFSQCAKALHKLAVQKQIKRKLEELYPERPRISEVTVTICGDSPRPRRSIPVVEAAVTEASQVAALADHCPELVNPEDYFWPRTVTCRLDDGTVLQSIESIVAFNKDLLVPGNFVVRCFLKRAESNYRLLESFRGKIYAAIKASSVKYDRYQKNLEAAWSSLTRLATEWRSLGVGRKMRLREACVSLTQLYAAITPGADVHWLGIPDKLDDRDQMRLRYEITSPHGPELFDRLARALSELRNMPSTADPAITAIEEAIASGGLVLVSSRQKAYWNGMVMPRFSAKEWKFFWTLTKKATVGAFLHIRDVYDNDAVSDSAMSTLWARVKQVLPPDLYRHVKPGSERASYRLEIAAHRIHLIS